MSNLDDMLAKRPIDPATLARLQNEIRQELQREQLAKLIDSHYMSWEWSLIYGERSWIECRCGWSVATQAEASQHTADAIIRAGWTPPQEKQ